MEKVQIGSRLLGAEDILAVCIGFQPVVLDEAALEKVRCDFAVNA